jgi:hypothetical protein
MGVLTNEIPLHPDCKFLEVLLGTWRGRGKGCYPTIEDFEYEEEVEFSHVGKPFLVYRQKTWDPQTGEGLHQEMGYWRALPEGRVEVVIAHPTGIGELLEGRISNGGIDLSSTAVALTLTAKDVRRMERSFFVDGDVLEYRLRMAAMGQPMSLHLEARLERVDPRAIR